MSDLEDSDQSGTKISGISSEKKGKTPLILDGRFFVIEPQNGDCGMPLNVTAKCVTCNKIIKGSYRATSNFLLHLKTLHKDIVRKYYEYKDSISRGSGRKRKNTGVDNSNNVSKRSCQEKADHFVIKYITRSGRPLSTVDDEDFQNLIKELSKLRKPVHCLSRKTLSERIKDESDKMVETLRKQLSQVSFVCTTADIWSSFRRSCLGVTVHWIDPHTFIRKSAAIACKRLEETHNYIAIAKLLTEIHDKYGLNTDKITCTITDNGSNFKRAFEELHVDVDPVEDEDEDDNEYTENEKSVEFANMNEFVNANEDEGYYLPKRYSCASHTLNLLGTTDVNEVIKSNRVYGKLHRSVFKKCSSVWNKTNRAANKASEEYRKIVGKAPKTPCITRWNTTYDSISDLLSVQDKLQKICEALEVPFFTTQDIEFLEEYRMCLSPVAFCLDKLQGENDMYLGDGLPWLFGLRHQLTRVGLDSNGQDSLKFCKTLKDGLITSFDGRFFHLMKLQDEARDYIVASVCHPKWKMRWLPQNLGDISNSVRKMVISAVKDMTTEEATSLTVKEIMVTSNDEEESFFDFIKSNEMSTAQGSQYCSIELELLQYLADNETSLLMLHKYRRLRTLFLKYNAGIPSSAPVERLFSFAGFVFSPRRSTLKNDIFEACTLLKANKHIK